MSQTAELRTTGPATTPVKHPAKHDNTVPIAAGGVLALIALGSAAVAVNRRRDEDEEQWIEEERTDMEPAAEVAPDAGRTIDDEQAPIVSPPSPAFQWGRVEKSAVPDDRDGLTPSDDREPGETWVERAYRGPSALNPSVSLKTRLKRAAFFDKRERDAAAGLAAPVDPAAGLPDRIIEEVPQQREDELA